MTRLSDLPHHILRLADLATRKPTHFELKPDAIGRAGVATSLGIPGLKKLRFSGQIAPQGQRDWALTAILGATVVQDCVITLAPVTTRIDEEILRIYLAKLADVEETEVEMPDDETVEAAPAMLDIAEVMIEALSLALPPFPRAPDAALPDAQFTAPGVQPLTDEDVRPFAGLKDLRESLEKKGDDDVSQ